MQRDVKFRTRFVARIPEAAEGSVPCQRARSSPGPSIEGGSGRLPRIPEMKLEICVKLVKNPGCFWYVFRIAVNLDQAKVSVSARCGDTLLGEQLNHIAEPMEVNSSNQAFRRDVTRA